MPYVEAGEAAENPPKSDMLGLTPSDDDATDFRRRLLSVMVVNEVEDEEDGKLENVAVELDAEARGDFDSVRDC